MLIQNSLKFLIDTFLTASGCRFGNISTMNNIGKLLLRQNLLDVIKMRAWRLMRIIRYHACRKMHANLLSILFKAAQALRQILQLNRQRTAGAATAGEAHVMRVFWITGKLALTAVKGVRTVVAATTLLHCITLDNYYQLAHFIMPAAFKAASSLASAAALIGSQRQTRSTGIDTGNLGNGSLDRNRIAFHKHSLASGTITLLRSAASLTRPSL